MICDFCSNPDVAWSYPMQAPDIDWVACEVCHGLIERGDYGDLADRALNAAGALGVFFDSYMLALRSGFLGHRTGPATKLA